jgi:hypothetical protein
MTSIHVRRRCNKYILALAGFCFVLALFFFISPTSARANAVTGGERPSFQVNAGFDTHYRDGNWVPVQVALRNDGPDFNGTLSLTAPTPLGSSNQGIPLHYQVSITLATGGQKQVTMYVPLYFDIQSVVVKLLDNNGSIVGSQTATLNPLMSGDVFVGILSDQSSGFGQLSLAPLPNQNGSVIIEFLHASTVPTIAAALKNFNAIVLDNFTTSSLSAEQLSALQTWVNQGGTFILAGGPEWHRTLGALPAGLVPVTVNGTTTIPAGTSLLPLGGPRVGRPGQNNVPDAVRFPVTISTATTMARGDPNKSEVILASPIAPLIVQARQGQGTIIYLAFDPTLEPILGWQGTSVLWEGLLLRSLGDQLLFHASISSGTVSSSQPAQSVLASRMSALLQSLLPNAIPSPWRTLAILFAGYILVLGPVRLLLVGRLKRRDWSWRIVLSSIIIFTLLSYGLAFKAKGTSILSDSITIAQLGQNGSPASIRTYLGIFVPNEGDFRVYIPGNGLVQPSPDNLSLFQGEPASPTEQSPATVTPVQGGTEVSLQGVDTWTLHAILTEQERQMHKGLISQLTLQNGILMGTVTNTLGYALGDSYLLMPSQVFSLGHLAAGETKQVRLKLSSRPLDPNATLADLLAPSSGSPDPYHFLSTSSPRTEQQRHLAILFALDEEGFYSFSSPCKGSCNPALPILPAPLGTNPATIGSTLSGGAVNIVATPGWPFTATTNYDPLLVPGSPATLIGWAENPSDLAGSVIVNDINPAGLHETLIQAPLNVNLAGSLDFPPNFIEGHLINVEGTNAQTRLPGVYAISTGSVTFEYIVPDTANLQISGLTITEPPNINLFAQAGRTVDADSLPFRLYNWHSGSWDAISLDQSTFTTNNSSAYIGPAGRILLQLANKDSSLGIFAFGKPLLNLQGVVLDNPSGNRQA